ncbi:hypothetical protein FQN57_005560 [Myotisia sp. PD_48]|nr:hypothetical protein FQN57_005560 [Myotisia sp. PD_48]
MLYPQIKALCVLALCLLDNGVVGKPFDAEPALQTTKYIDTRATGDWRKVSAISMKRRQEALDKFFPIRAPDESKLPNDLRSYMKTSRLLSRDELRIINMEAEELLSKIQRRQLTAVKVATAFSKAAVIAQNLTNCLTEVIIEEGLKRAQFLDNYQRRTGKVIGPLHGLPISLKDSYITPPFPSSIGMAYHANVPTDIPAVMVTMLEDMGAVFYVKTNVPTAMMMMETINNVYGETRNPIHKKLTPGGSSGGEGALIAMRASPLGIGTDIGGSVRIPSGFCHLYGLKPSFGRFPTWGNRAGIPGQDLIYSVSGPMSTSLRTVELFSEAMVSAGPWNSDPKLHPIPWKKNVISRHQKLRFAIFPCRDGVATCYPPVERALQQVKAALQRAGHEVVDWVPTNQAAIEGLAGEIIAETGSDALLPMLKAFNEPLLGTMKFLFPNGKPGGTGLGPEKLRQLIIRRNQIQKDHLDQWMGTASKNRGPIDGLISPIHVAPAPRLSSTPELVYAGFTGYGNMLDLPACTFPVTYSSKKLDPKRPKTWVPISQRDEMIQADYDPAFWDEAPVSLQLLGKRLEEEKVLEMTKIVADILKFEHREH